MKNRREILSDKLEREKACKLAKKGNEFVKKLTNNQRCAMENEAKNLKSENLQLKEEIAELKCKIESAVNKKDSEINEAYSAYAKLLEENDKIKKSAETANYLSQKRKERIE